MMKIVLATVAVVRLIWAVAVPIGYLNSPVAEAEIAMPPQASAFEEGFDDDDEADVDETCAKQFICSGFAPTRSGTPNQIGRKISNADCHS